MGNELERTTSTNAAASNPYEVTASPRLRGYWSRFFHASRRAWRVYRKGRLMDGVGPIREFFFFVSLSLFLLLLTCLVVLVVIQWFAIPLFNQPNVAPPTLP